MFALALVDANICSLLPFTFSLVLSNCLSDNSGMPSNKNKLRVQRTSAFNTDFYPNVSCSVLKAFTLYSHKISTARGKNSTDIQGVFSTASGALVVGGVRDICSIDIPGDRFECSME